MINLKLRLLSKPLLNYKRIGCAGNASIVKSVDCKKTYCRVVNVFGRFMLYALEERTILKSVLKMVYGCAQHVSSVKIVVPQPLDRLEANGPTTFHSVPSVES